jgi:hypothetical protein
MARMMLRGMAGYLLALRYKRAASLGNALRQLHGIIYWLSAENEWAVIWLDENSILKLPNRFVERLSYLAQFEISDKTGTCDKCNQSLLSLA